MDKNELPSTLHPVCVPVRSSEEEKKVATRVHNFFLFFISLVVLPTETNSKIPDEKNRLEQE